LKRKLTLYSQVIRRGWLQRTLRLSGDVETLIEYDARGFGVDGAAAARIRVNGQEVTALLRGSYWQRHRLMLPPLVRHGPTPVLEIEFSRLGLIQLRFFRLTLNREVLYEEDRGVTVRLLEPPPLPIPANTPPPDPADLPIASQLIQE
jgi:hypothetical protein